MGDHTEHWRTGHVEEQLEVGQALRELPVELGRLDIHFAYEAGGGGQRAGSRAAPSWFGEAVVPAG